MPELRLTAGFEKDVKRLSAEDRKHVERALEKFVDNPKRPSLNFEAVTGQSNLYSIRASYHVRILMRRDADAATESYVLLAAGRHEVYRRR